MLLHDTGKGIKTYKLKTCIRKVYYNSGVIYKDKHNNDYDWEKHLYTKNLQEFVNIMNEVMPGYILQHGKHDQDAYFFELKILPGTNLSKYPHTKEFKKRVRDFCVESIKKTFPYSHGDWHPDNILDHNGQWTLVDWDWVGKRSLLETQQIINQRLKAIFGYEVDIVQKRELLFMEKL